MNTDDAMNSGASTDQLPPAPPWLDEQPEIRAMLSEALKRLSVPGRRIARIPIDAAGFPELHHGGERADQTWALLRRLAGEYGIARLHLHKHRDPYAPEFIGTRLDFPETSEPLLRHWLERPRVSAAALAWQQAVARRKSLWPAEGTARLAAKPVRIEGRSDDETVDAFAAIAAHLSSGLSLRQLSACCFFGDSKFLDGRAALLAALYPSLEPALRPLAVCVHVPTVFEAVLFIENQESYTRSLQGSPAAARKLALVYAAGYRGAAARIRERSGAVLHFTASGSSPPSFERWWFGEEPGNFPIFFWGDLDFDGLRILKGLRAQFGAEAWRPGYAPLLARLEAGLGHAPAAADKENQRLLESTGCSYADTVLLPALMARGAFVDQESFW